jgi:anti-anti-sigma factor
MDAPQPPVAAVRVAHGLGDARRPITVIHVVGQHDFSLRELLAEALEPIDGHVVIDLTLCSFLDSSLIGAILGKARLLRSSGSRLELVRPRGGPVHRVMERLGISALVPTVDEVPRVSPSA